MKVMRKNDWTEEKAVNSIKNIFLDNELIHEILTNDKTEFIDGYVYVSNEINTILDLDIGKIEIQIKGRTNSRTKTIDVKKTFFDYCKTNIVPVSMFFVNINTDKSVEGIYLKYIDENSIKSTNSGYSIKFTNEDIVNSYNIVEKLKSMQSIHLNKIISKLNNSKTHIKNEEAYYFIDSIMRNVNGFIYTKLNKYMKTYFEKILKFGIVYCINRNHISYSIIPILKGNLLNNIIEVNDTKDILKLRVLKIYGRYIEFTDECSSKLITYILKETIISSILNIRLFCKLNKSIAKRSLIYHLNHILIAEKNRLLYKQDMNNIPKYNDEIKQVLLEDKTKYSKDILNNIVNDNIHFIENKLYKDINFYKQHETLSNFTFRSECNDNKFTIDVIDNNYVVKTTKESIYYLLRELLKFIDDNETIDINEYNQIEGNFLSQNDVENYIKLKYDCICEFCKSYLNLQPRLYIWNGIFNDKDFSFSNRGTECVQVYYSNYWKNSQDKTINDSYDYPVDFEKGLISVGTKVLKSPHDIFVNHEILVKEIYEDIRNMICESIERYY